MDPTKAKTHLSAGDIWYPWLKQDSTHPNAGFRARDDIRGQHANSIKYSWSRDDQESLLQRWFYQKTMIARSDGNDYKFGKATFRFASSYDESDVNRG